MLKTITLLIKKDLQFCLNAGVVFTQAVLPGLLLIFLMGMAGSELPAPSPRLIASSFWLASLLSVIMLAPALYNSEKPGLAALLTAGADSRLIWLGKTLSLLILLAGSQLVYSAACYIFFDAPLQSHSMAIIFGIILCNVGLCSLGALLAPLAGGASARALAGLILVPLCLPLLLTGINLASGMCSQETSPDTWRTVLFIVASDLVFISASLLLCAPILRESANE